MQKTKRVVSAKFSSKAGFYEVQTEAGTTLYMTPRHLSRYANGEELMKNLLGLKDDKLKRVKDLLRAKNHSGFEVSDSGW